MRDSEEVRRPHPFSPEIWTAVAGRDSGGAWGSDEGAARLGAGGDGRKAMGFFFFFLRTGTLDCVISGIGG